MTDLHQKLRDDLAANASQIASLQSQHDEIIASSQSANADDEHDPEGATIAFERAQIAALLQLAHRSDEELRRALERLDQGLYGVCEGCGGRIGAERLQARPGAGTCITCASAPR